MDDMNQQQSPVSEPVRPVEWSWISQRQENDDKTSSLWKVGFIAPDGANVQVSFHSVGNTTALDKEKKDKEAQNAQSQLAMGMPPSPDPTNFSPEGQPNPHDTEDVSYYVTFFTNRNPEYFMKWDTSLAHEDSLIVWVTITHIIVDFVRKANPANVILDDLANGKLKMVLHSVALDVVAANSEFELEQTQKHHYRTFFQIKKIGKPSAFDADVKGTPREGETEIPDQPTEVETPETAPESEDTGMVNAVDDDKNGDPTIVAPPKEKIQQGVSIEIGKDYSVAVKDNENNAIDRYQGKNPADILRWIKSKGYGTSRMKIVDSEQPSGKEENVADIQNENFKINGNKIIINKVFPAAQAAAMNHIINAEKVRCTLESVEFTFASDKDMKFKQALVELAFKRTS